MNVKLNCVFEFLNTLGGSSKGLLYQSVPFIFDRLIAEVSQVLVRRARQITRDNHLEYYQYY